MFMGEYAHNVDKKGRIIIPAKFRDELKEHLILTRGYDGCLAIYTPKQWEKIYEELLRLPATKKDARMYIRKITSKAAECEIDGQGRILLPASLMKLACIQKECMVIGAANHIEIWAKEIWEAMENEDTFTFEEIAENLTEYMM